MDSRAKSETIKFAMVAIFLCVLTITIGNAACSGADVKEPQTEFEKCLYNIAPKCDSWSIFGDVTCPEIDSAAVEKCVSLGLREQRQGEVREFGNDLESTTKLEYISEGVPKQTNWRK